jgi:hypothetical protein
LTAAGYLGSYKINKKFLVHRLVQDVTRRGLAAEERGHSLNEALTWMDAAFEGSPQDIRNWPLLDALAPHIRVIVEYADEVKNREPTSRLMDQLGLLQDTKARHSEAEPLYRRALAIDEAS